MKEVSNRIYPFLDYSKDISKLKCALRNSIYGVFQEIKQELVSPVYTEEPKVCLLYENKLLPIEHICYMELPNEVEPLVSIVFEGKNVRGLKSLTIEELETVYKLMYSYVK
jgi:hypothetical protein